VKRPPLTVHTAAKLVGVHAQGGYGRTVCLIHVGTQLPRQGSCHLIDGLDGGRKKESRDVWV